MEFYANSARRALVSSANSICDSVRSLLLHDDSVHRPGFAPSAHPLCFDSSHDL